MVICVKTAEKIEIPFRLWVWMDPGNHKLDRGPGPPMGKRMLRERGTHCKV